MHRTSHSAATRVLDAFARSTAFSLRLISRLRFCTPFPLLGPTTLGSLGTKPVPAAALDAAAVAEGVEVAFVVEPAASPPFAFAFAACRLASFAARCFAKSPFLRFGLSPAENVDLSTFEYAARNDSTSSDWTVVDSFTFVSFLDLPSVARISKGHSCASKGLAGLEEEATASLISASWPACLAFTDEVEVSASYVTVHSSFVRGGSP